MRDYNLFITLTMMQVLVSPCLGYSYFSPKGLCIIISLLYRIINQI